ncbi:hypothetical protein PG984_012990 [Apiospora sp. TS-2023a]
MADPLSVAGLAAGVVSLGIQVTGGLLSYLDAIRSREEDLALAKQYVGSIQAAINHINSSPSRTQASQTASASIKASMDACKVQLKALEDLVNRLSSAPGSNATLRSKLRDSSKKLAYAFHRPDIKELEEKLSRADSTLQGAMQALGLLVTAVRADTRHAKASLQSVNSEMLIVQSETKLANTYLREVTTTTLPAIAEDVAKRGPLIVDKVSGLELRLAEQTQMISDGFTKNTQTSAEHSLGVMQKLDRLEALFQRSLDMNLDDALSQGANVISARLMSKPSALQEIADVTESTTTTAHHKKPFQTSVLSTKSPREDLPVVPDGCNCRRRRRVRQRKQRKWGPLLAFDEIEIIELHRPDCEFSPFAMGSRSRKLGLAYTGLRTVASPRALIECIKMDTGIGATITDMLTMLLGYYGARPVSCNVKGQTPFSELFQGLADLLDPCEAVGDFAIKVSTMVLSKIPEIPLPSDQSLTSAEWSGRADPLIYVLGTLGSSEDIAEAFGCGPLSLAILAQDVSRVETILDTSPSSMDEITTLGLTPLHLALDKPAWLNSPDVLDINAQAAANLLYYNRVTTSFNTYGVSCDSSCNSSVYHYLTSPDIATVFYEMGFRDISACDNNGRTPLIAATRGHYWGYLTWLLGHGADLFSALTITAPSIDRLVTQARGTKPVHHVAQCARRAAIYHDTRNCFSIMIEHVSDVDVVDGCSCGCSSHGCDSASVLFRELWPGQKEGLKKILRCCGTFRDTKWMESVTRTLTFDALGLTHTCCKYIYLGDSGFATRYEIEEVDDIRDFESDDLDLLESLIDDFHARLEEISVAGSLQVEDYLDFLDSYWSDRIQAELEKKHQNRTWEQEKQDTIQLGVQWEDESVSVSFIEDEDRLEHLSQYIDELDMIVAGKPPIFCPDCRWKPCRRRPYCSP